MLKRGGAAAGGDPAAPPSSTSGGVAAGAGAGASASGPAVPTNTTCDAGGDFFATINYSRADGSRHRDASGDRCVVPVECPVRDGRAAGVDATLPTHGFQLVHCPTALSYAAFTRDADAIRTAYYPEVVAEVQRLTGAARVVAFHHMVRTARDSATVRGVVEAPVCAAHADYPSHASVKLFDRVARAGERRGRFALFNAWRSITGVPIRDQHLAVADARSVAAPDDFVEWDHTQPDGTVAASYRLDPGRHRRHRWFYFPAMRRDEVLVFTQYDSDVDAAARYTFHTAATDPRAPPGYPPRESIEVRLIAFFPHHAPNTVPAIVTKGSEAVNAVYQRILSALCAPQHWPADAKRWMQRSLAAPDGVASIINGIVAGGVKDGHHGMAALTPAQVEDLRAKLFDNRAGVEAQARRHFQ